MILHQFQLHPHLQQLSDLLVGEQEVKGMSGQQTDLVDMVLSVMTTGTTMMRGLFVDNLDSLVVLQFMVNLSKIMYYSHYFLLTRYMLNMVYMVKPENTHTHCYCNQ